MTPIRNARVEVLDAVSQTLISVAETDSSGRFTALIPSIPVIVRVLSRLRSTDLGVVDNWNNGAPYPISTEFDFREKKLITEDNFEEVFAYWCKCLGDAVEGENKPSRFLSHHSCHRFCIATRFTAAASGSNGRSCDVRDLSDACAV